MSKKAQERIYFKNRELVEQYRTKHPDAILTRFIKDQSDLDRTEWIGYNVEDAAQSQPTQNNGNANVPEVA